MSKRQLILGISGASGSILGIRMLKILADMKDVCTHLIVSESAVLTMSKETKHSLSTLTELADFYYSNKDLAAPLASGSNHYEAMMIVPCSIKTLSAVTHSHTSNLMTRAADVCLKEGVPLLLAVRETPFHLGHLELMKKATTIGAIIHPPIPSFYSGEENLSDIIDHTLGRMLKRIGFPNDYVTPWRNEG